MICCNWWRLVSVARTSWLIVSPKWSGWVKHLTSAQRASAIGKKEGRSVLQRSTDPAFQILDFRGADGVADAGIGVKLRLDGQAFQHAQGLGCPGIRHLRIGRAV